VCHGITDHRIDFLCGACSFGASVRGSRTGIIFNDEMDDLSTPGTTNGYGVVSSPSNYIKPGKMPMSSMSPTIVFDSARRRVVYVSGAAGGTHITTQTAFVSQRFLLCCAHNTRKCASV